MEIEIAKKRHGQLNTIVMNAVMQACVHCADIESALRLFDEMSGPEGCGVDNITYATLLKVFVTLWFPYNYFKSCSL